MACDVREGSTPKCHDLKIEHRKILWYSYMLIIFAYDLRGHGREVSRESLFLLYVLIRLRKILIVKAKSKELMSGG